MMKSFEGEVYQVSLWLEWNKRDGYKTDDI